MIKSCKLCSVEFDAVPSNVTLCSDACRNASIKLVQKKWRDKQPAGFHTQRVKEWESRVTGTASCRHYRKRYGLTLEQVTGLFDAQEGKCKICNLDMILGGQGATHACVDHCHKTGKVRGLLCTNCNILLGKAMDDIKILQSAIAYLRNNE